MSYIYLSQGFRIYPHSQAIEQGDNRLQVRPKTFALLLLLLEKPREVLDKRFLLDNIWDDVKVEEQVLVQSVRELRQIFGSADIIQTYPRKGYAWAADVEKHADCAPLIEIPSTPSPVKKRSWKSLPAIKLTALVASLAVAAVLVGVSILFVYKSSQPALAPEQSQVVIVLPVKIQMPGNEHNWVPLGAMDQLINLLVSNPRVQVMNSEYVFQLMRFAHLPRDYASEQVARVFDVSGATLVVESQLSGIVENYRLDYKLRTRNDVKRGAILDKDINQIIYKLGELIVRQTGQQLSSADHNAQTAFANELMARGLESLDKKEFSAALSLFASLKQLEPKNIPVREQLIKTLLRTEKFELALEEIAAALTLAKTENPPAMAGLTFAVAMAQERQGHIDEALRSLQQADTLAAANNNLLVQAEIAGTRARIHQQRGEFPLAQASFERALNFDSAIRCAIGLSYNHIGLAQVLLAQGLREQAREHYQAAKSLIESRHLDEIRPELDALEL